MLFEHIRRAVASQFSSHSHSRRTRKASRQLTARRRLSRPLQLESLEDRKLLTGYFVDAVNGSDNNFGTSPEQAFETWLPFVAAYGQSDPNIGKINLEAGDVVEFLPGTYSATFQNPSEAPHHGFHLANVHGTVDQPIIIRGRPGAVLDAIPPDRSESTTADFFQVSNVRIEGLEFTGLGMGLMVQGSANITIVDNWFHDIDGTAASNIAGLFLAGDRNVDVHNNLFQDNYDRSKANPNNRHIVLFTNDGPVRVHHNVLKNTPSTDAEVTGAGISVKHSGDGSFEADHNIIINAYNHSIGTGSRNSRIHHNLIIDSAAITVINGGGTAHISDIEIHNNTVSNTNADSQDGGGLSYEPTDENETDGQGKKVNGPIGPVGFTDNIVYDTRSYNIDRSLIGVGTYAPDELYEQVIEAGNLSVDRNVYFNPNENPQFNIFNANFAPGGPKGGAYDLREWQAQGFDVSSVFVNPRFDDAYLPQTAVTQSSGWYADESPRLTVLNPGMRDAVEGTSTTFVVVRSGEGIDLTQPLTVTLTATDDSELKFSRSVTIPAGQAKAYFDVEAVSDGEVDGARAVRVSAAAAGFTENVSAWLRVEDDGRVSEVPTELGTLVTYEISVHDIQGNEISQVSAGESFFVDVIVRDMRDPAEQAGVFSAYADLRVDRPDLLDVDTTSLIYGRDFANGRQGVVSDGTLVVDEGGAFSGSLTDAPAKRVLFTIQATAANLSGMITFSLDEADILVEHDTLLFGQNVPVDRHRLNFESKTIDVIACDVLDVNCDGHVSPLDALRVINSINARPQSSYDMSLDTNKDGSISPIDVLLIINAINQKGVATGESEQVKAGSFVIIDKPWMAYPTLKDPQCESRQAIEEDKDAFFTSIVEGHEPKPTLSAPRLAVVEEDLLKLIVDGLVAASEAN